ncbi:MAG: F510_1955 family glycosylhydrolase [Pseudonocardiaceae bacterium]
MRGSQSPGARRAVAGGLVAIAVFTGVAACTSRGSESAPPEGGSVQFAHVHGLGVDPGTGDLYAGTHHGLIRFPQRGEPIRVGAAQDFMGFTVIGPNHFLASGHPGAGQDGPSNVGLIESTDGGRSWQTLSLAEQADFHTLETSNGLVYGSNAGQLMVSKDGRTWDTRVRIALADLAVSPEDQETLLATTQQGLSRSTDGGRSFELVAGAPLLQLVTWTDTGGTIGITPEGTVHVSSDGGITWSQRGSAGGAPEALTASAEQIYVAVEGKIVSSDDGGRTFRTRHQGS